MIPSLDEVLDGSHVLSLPMRTKFRGITTREVMLVRGPAGWGEFSPFTEYDDQESSAWLRSGIEAAWDGPPEPHRERVRINATVPAVPATEVPGILARYPGVDTAKVKVAEKGQTVADDVERVRAVRAVVPRVRVDANGGWTVDEAVEALSLLLEDGELEYAEQPCATVPELVEVRRRLPGLRVAADESIRRAEDPLRVVRAGGADVAVVKVAPLGGMRALLELAGELGEYGVPVVVSSALDSAVGISAGIAAAAAIPKLEFACGLGTGSLFVDDVCPGQELVDGTLLAGSVEPDSSRLEALAASDERVRWWHERVRRTYAFLN
ncbi:MAG: o-succinylbenzoate synthase [Rhodococcus sp. (in: high G+C Gram-positive bacteria)]|uniref:o-succinylbenzoate synthase n=1 Tax=Rhodococcus sp. EPR-157 TaxID=1813677 RepID=UPI0007BBFE62|nr:o-succinylbenzoate synthase [Rhodococcus sp. EPR-157]KZF04358.1 O-succinylbenzoate synthase [Rhodococcus sp. EPR-157]